MKANHWPDTWPGLVSVVLKRLLPGSKSTGRPRLPHAPKPPAKRRGLPWARMTMVVGNRRSAALTRPAMCLLLMVPLFATLMTSGCGGDADIAGLSARLIEIGQRVEVNNKPAVQDQKLAVSDVVVVFKGSFAVIKFPDGTRINLFYDDLRRTDTKLEMASYQPKTVTTMALKLVSGVLSAIVPPDRKGIDRYEVEAAHTVTAIEGTEVKVSTNGTLDEVALKKGKVAVTHKVNGTKVELDPRTQIGATAGGFQKVRPYNGLAESEERFFLNNPKELYRY